MPQVTHTTHCTALFIVAALLTACGASTGAQSTNSSMLAPTNLQTLPIGNGAAKQLNKADGKKAQLYVGNWATTNTSSISVYNATRKRPLATITDGVYFPWPAIGPDGRLYVANEGNATVSIYDAAKHDLLQTLSTGKVSEPHQMAFDSLGTLYVLCSGGVEVFPNTSQQNAYTLRGNKYGVAVDSMNDLWVSAGLKVYGYRPGATKPFVTLHDGINSAEAIATDGNNNLYIANARSRMKDPGSVAVYSTETDSLEYALTSADGIQGPSNLLVGSDGNLYVDNEGGTITSYPLGQTSLNRTITSGLYSASGLAMDGSGNLYVSNLGANDVTVYAPNSTSVLRTITKGIATPYGIAFGI